MVDGHQQHGLGPAISSAGGGGGVLTNPPSKIIWSYAFDMLKTSADDGHRTLYLNFGADGEGDVEIDMECCPKPVVFVLHNCLSAKVHSLAV